MTLKRILQRSDPFRKKECNNTNCLVCSTGGKGPCQSTSVTYELVCQLCRQKYIGETSRSVYTRGKEHLRALEQRQQSLVMWRHSYEKLDDSVPGFTMNVTGMFQSDAMLRQISESIQINKVQQDQLINTKSEWSYFRILRAVVTQSWDEATNILSYDYCQEKMRWENTSPCPMIIFFQSILRFASRCQSYF